MAGPELGRSRRLVRRLLRLDLLDPFAEVVHLREVQDLGLLVLGQVPVTEELEAFGRRHRQLDLLVEILLVVQHRAILGLQSGSRWDRDVRVSRRGGSCHDMSPSCHLPGMENPDLQTRS